MDKLIEVLDFFLNAARKSNGKVEPVSLKPKEEHGGVTATFIVFDIYGNEDIKRFSEIKSLLVEGEKSTRAYREHLQTAIKIAEKIGVDIQWQKKNEQ